MTTQQRTAEQEALSTLIRKALNACVNASAERLGELRDRWQDEKEYEDFKDYVAEMKKLIPEGFTFVKATKSPFGFHIAHPRLSRMNFVVFANARSVSWKGIII